MLSAAEQHQTDGVQQTNGLVGLVTVDQDQHNQHQQQDNQSSEPMLSPMSEELAQATSADTPLESKNDQDNNLRVQIDVVDESAEEDDRTRGDTEDTPTAGVLALYSHMVTRLHELDELCLALQSRISIEEAYRMRLADFSRAVLSFDLTGGFVNALGGVHGQPLGAVAYGGIPGVAFAPSHVGVLSSSESHKVDLPNPTTSNSLMPVAHSWATLLLDSTQPQKKHTDTLILSTLTPLQSFSASTKKQLERKKTQVDTHFKAFQKVGAEVSQKYATYVSKSQNAHTKDLDTAKADYVQVLKSAEHARAALEFHITDFLVWAEETEFYRLKMAREVFWALESAQLASFKAQVHVWEPTNASTPSASGTTSPSLSPKQTSKLKTPSPAEALDALTLSLRTGTRRPKSFTFTPPPSSSSDSTNYNTQPISTVVLHKTISMLHDLRLLKKRNSGLAAWIRPASVQDLPSVQILRLEMTKGGKKGWGDVGTERLKKEVSGVLVGLLKGVVAEVKGWGVLGGGEEVGGVLGMVYGMGMGGEEAEEARLNSVSSLLETLPETHYEALKLLSGYMYSLVQDLPPNSKKLKRLAHTFGSLILRIPPTPPSTENQPLSKENPKDDEVPLYESDSTQPLATPKEPTDIPYLFALDLLRHHPTIFEPLSPTFFNPPSNTVVEESESEDEDLEFPHSHHLEDSTSSWGLSKAVSSLNLRDVVGEGVVGGWKGLVKSVSSLHLRGGDVGASGVSGTGGGGAGEWFGWGVSTSAATAPEPVAGGGAKVEKGKLDGCVEEEEEDDLELDQEMETFPCHWADCSEECQTPEQLMAHLRSVHMSPTVSGHMKRRSAGSASGGSKPMEAVIEE
ncbi:hypothetical protein HDV05_007022 [Chytridiales sp. JEL 0842]|nr:hypothetical protein HDV05_007022 [Chytridiales sp. JEL 0842]